MRGIGDARPSPRASSRPGSPTPRPSALAATSSARSPSRPASRRSSSTTGSARTCSRRSPSCPSTTRRAPRRRSSPRMAPRWRAAIGSACTLIDLGAGNCAKAARLFPLLEPSRYVAVDISVEFLRDALRQRAARAPAASTSSASGQDFSSSLDAAAPSCSASERPVFFYPGSSIGNFTPRRGARASCAACAQRASRRRPADRRRPGQADKPCSRPPTTTRSASPRRSTSTLLRHLNRLIGSDFDPRQWRHVAFFDEASSRIEMHLEARASARRALAGRRAPLRRRRAHPHRELVQVHGRRLRRDCCVDAGFDAPRHWTDRAGLVRRVLGRGALASAPRCGASARRGSGRTRSRDARHAAGLPPTWTPCPGLTPFGTSLRRRTGASESKPCQAPA